MPEISVGDIIYLNNFNSAGMYETSPWKVITLQSGTFGNMEYIVRNHDYGEDRTVSESEIGTTAFLSFNEALEDLTATKKEVYSRRIEDGKYPESYTFPVIFTPYNDGAINGIMAIYPDFPNLELVTLKTMDDGAVQDATDELAKHIVYLEYSKRRDIPKPTPIHNIDTDQFADEVIAMMNIEISMSEHRAEFLK